MAGHVLVAPDKFKGTLTAPEAAEAIAAGVFRVRPDIEIRRMPVADGGDGTVEAVLATAHAAGSFRRIRARVLGPTGEPVRTVFASRADTAVVELASASGLALLPSGQFAPMSASSFGTGELIRAALDHGVRRIVLGVGGSACTDGGAGMVTALGARIHGDTRRPGAGTLANVSEVDLSGLDARLHSTEIVLASDVDNPLLGMRGAARVYGPQKGANPDQVESLESALTSWARAVASVVGQDFAGEPGAGAAGGVGFAGLAILGARRCSGVDTVLDLAGFDDQIPGAALVITGEGTLDEQTARGKAPAGVAARAAQAGVPTVAVAGRCRLSPERWRAAGFADAYAGTGSSAKPDQESGMRQPGSLVSALSERAAKEWL